MGTPMKPMQQFTAAYRSVWRAILHDKAAVLLLFVAGIVYSFFYPLPYSAEKVFRAPIAVVDQDHGSLARQITRYADAHPQLDVVAIDTDPALARERLWRNEVVGVMILPAGMQADVLAGRKAQVLIAGNGTQFLLNRSVLGALASVVGTVSAGIEIKKLETKTASPAQAAEQRQPIQFDAEPLFNVREGYGAYLVPGVAVIIAQQTLLLAMTLLFGTWHEHGGFPVRRDGAGYLGTLAAFATASLVNCLYYFGFVFWWQGYPRDGSPLAMVLLALLFSLTIAALGIWLGLMFRTRERGMQVLLFAAMPMLFVADLSWPAQALPEPLQMLRWLVPSTAGIQGFLAVNQMHASLAQVAFEIVALAALCAAASALGLRRWLARDGGSALSE
jgi:ABC-2 type transport system permease protein